MISKQWCLKELRQKQFGEYQDSLIEVLKEKFGLSHINVILSRNFSQTIYPTCTVYPDNIEITLPIVQGCTNKKVVTKACEWVLNRSINGVRSPLPKQVTKYIQSKEVHQLWSKLFEHQYKICPCELPLDSEGWFQGRIFFSHLFPSLWNKSLKEGFIPKFKNSNRPLQSTPLCVVDLLGGYFFIEISAISECDPEELAFILLYGQSVLSCWDFEKGKLDRERLKRQVRPSPWVKKIKQQISSKGWQFEQEI